MMLRADWTLSGTLIALRPSAPAGAPAPIRPPHDRARPASSDESRSEGGRNGVGSVPCAQLAKDPPDMSLDCILRNEQLSSDLCIAFPIRHSPAEPAIPAR